MTLKEILVAEASFCVREHVDRDELLRRMVRALARSAPASFPDQEAVVAELLRRESATTTAFGLGVAIPHCFVRGVGRPRLSVGCSGPGVDFHSLDGGPTHVVFLLVEDSPAGGQHTELLSRIARLCRDTPLVARLGEAADPAAFPRIIGEEEKALD